MCGVSHARPSPKQGCTFLTLPGTLAFDDDTFLEGKAPHFELSRHVLAQLGTAPAAGLRRDPCARARLQVHRPELRSHLFRLERTRCHQMDTMVRLSCWQSRLASPLSPLSCARIALSPTAATWVSLLLLACCPGDTFGHQESGLLPASCVLDHTDVLNVAAGCVSLDPGTPQVRRQP